MKLLFIADLIGSTGTFLSYGAIGALGVVILILFLPETKGKTLEEVGQELNRK